MKLHTREGTMLVWALSLSIVLGVLCATALRSAFDSFEIGVSRVTYQQNMRVLRLSQEYVDWYVQHKLTNQVGVNEIISLGNKILPSYDITINISVQSHGIHIALTVQHECTIFGMEYVVRKK